MNWWHAMPERRVLVFNHFAAPPGQPGGTRHSELFSRLDGWRYLIVASRRNVLTGEWQADAAGFRLVKVARHSSNGGRRVLGWLEFGVRATLAGLVTKRPHVVYGSSPHLVAALAGWIVAVLRRARFVLEVRDLWPKVLLDMGVLSESSLVFRCLSSVEGFLYRRADAVVVMAEGSRNELMRRGVEPSRIHYIPNGSDPEDFHQDESREALRARWGFDRFTVVYAGAHGPANGLDLLLDAAVDVADLDLDIVLIGGGVERETLMKRARDEGIRNVTFLDPVPKSEVGSILVAADAGVHVLADVELFRSAVSPNKVFDYMAAGLPVLTNSPGLVGDLVTTTGAGVSVEPGGLADGLREMVLLPRPSAGKAGQDWIAGHQSRSAMARRLDDLLRSVTGTS